MGLLGFHCYRFLRVRSSEIPSSEHLCTRLAGCSQWIMISPLSLLSLLSLLPIPTSFLPSSLHLSLYLSLVSCDPQLCPRIRTVSSSLDVLLVKNLVSHSLGKQSGAPSAVSQGAGTLLYACSTGRSDQGTMEKFRILCPEQVRRMWLGERCPCRLRASFGLLSQTCVSSCTD